MFDKNTDIKNERIVPASVSMNHDWFQSFMQRVKNDQDNILKDLGPNDLLSPSLGILLAANTLTAKAYQNPQSKVYIDVFSSKYDVAILNKTEQKDLALIFRELVIENYYAVAEEEKDMKDIIVPTTIRTLNMIEKLYHLDSDD